MKCANCGEENLSGKNYRFYYGKTGQSVSIDRRTTWTPYAIDGWEDVDLCDPCVDAKIERRARITAGLAFLGALLLAALRLLMDRYAPQNAPALEKALGFPMAFIIGITLYLGIRSWKKGKQRQEEAESLAIKTQKQALRSHGYDAFFTQTDYNRKKV